MLERLAWAEPFIPSVWMSRRTCAPDAEVDAGLALTAPAEAAMIRVAAKMEALVVASEANRDRRDRFTAMLLLLTGRVVTCLDEIVDPA